MKKERFQHLDLNVYKSTQMGVIMEWFTVEKIDDLTYAISEYKHWERVHSYLLLGTKKALLIDTGLGISNIKQVVEKLTKLPVMVTTTHVHWDHIGGHGLFDDISVHHAERAWLAEKSPMPITAVKNQLLKEECDFSKDFNIDNYQVYLGTPSTLLEDGDIIELGDRQIQVIHTPGHSPGHLCFYEEDAGYLFTGDLIYEGTLYAFYPSTDPVLFRESVNKLKGFSYSKILPGHNKLDIPVSIIADVQEAFEKLYQKGDLVQGRGIFDFGTFKLHI